MPHQRSIARRLPGWLALPLLLVLVKLWLVGAQDLSVAGPAAHDDRGFLDAAIHVLSGEWLGPYDARTLIKGPFYPLWMAAVFVAGLPLLLAEHLLYLLACAVFVAAIEPLYADPHHRRRSLSVMLWVVLAFNPMSFSDGPMTRVVREGIYPSLSLLVLAGAAALAARRAWPSRRRVGWALLLGFALGAFWLTREEGVWLLPSVMLLIGAAIPALRPMDRRLVGRLGFLASPFLIAALVVAAVAVTNQAYYGEAVVVEIQAQPFRTAYGALSRVGAEHFRRRVPVPEAARWEIYRVSPAFAELESSLEGRPGRRWIGTSCRRTQICDDIAGGWFLWALREAVAAAGHHESAEEAAAYYRRLAAEIDTACAEGRLRCAAPRATLSPVWHEEYWVPLGGGVLRAVNFLIRFKHFEAEPSSSFGPWGALARFETLTRERVAPRERRSLEVGGWVLSPGAEVELVVLRRSGARAEATISLRRSESAWKFFRRRGLDLEQAPRARFTVGTTCTDGCRLEVRAGGRRLARVPLDGRPRILDRPDLYLNVWPGAGRVGEFATGTRLRDDKIALLYGIGAIYQMLTPPLAGLALLTYLWLTVMLLRDRRLVGAWVLASSLLGALAARILILALIDVTSYPAIHRTYLASAYPILLAFIGIVLATGGQRLYRFLQPRLFTI